MNFHEATNTTLKRRKLMSNWSDSNMCYHWEIEGESNKEEKRSNNEKLREKATKKRRETISNYNPNMKCYEMMSTFWEKRLRRKKQFHQEGSSKYTKCETNTKSSTDLKTNVKNKTWMISKMNVLKGLKWMKIQWSRIGEDDFLQWSLKSEVWTQ